MPYIQMCELCLQAFEPEEVVPGGIRRLKTFKGYTVDVRLQQFRKMEPHELPEFIEFSSTEGQQLLAHMHEAVTR